MASFNSTPRDGPDGMDTALSLERFSCPAAGDGYDMICNAKKARAMINFDEM